MPTPSFIGAGTLGATGNNYSSGATASATLPSGMTAGKTFMLLFAFFDTGATTTGQSISTPSGWTDLSLDAGAQANSQLSKVFGRVYQAGDTAPAPAFTGGTTGTSGATGLAVILAYDNIDVSAFPGTPTSVLDGTPGAALNQTTTSLNIGPIAGCTTVANNAVVIMYGGKSSPTGGNPTGFTSGFSFERVDAGSTNAGDAWLFIAETPQPTPTTAANQTLTGSGGTASKAVGRMFALKALVATTINRSPSSLTFSATAGGANPPDQNVSITNTGDAGTTLNWTASDDAAWLSITASGTAPSTLVASVNTSGLAGGTYNGTITISATGATNTPQTVPVTLSVLPMPVNNNAEGGTDLTTITTGNSGGASGDAFGDVVIGSGGTLTFASDQEAHGSLSLKLSVGSFGNSTYFGWRIGTQARVYGRAYCRLSATPTGAGQSLVSAFNGSPGNAPVLAILIDASNHVRVVKATGTSTTISVTFSSAAIATNSWFRIEWDFNFATGALEVRYFATLDSLTATETLTGSGETLFAATADRVEFGGILSAANTADEIIWFDDLNVNLTGFPGPSFIVPTLPFNNNAEGGTDTVAITASNSGGTSGDPFQNPVVGSGASVIFASDQEAHGSLAHKIVQGATASVTYFGWYLSAVQTRLFGRAYCRVSALSTGIGEALITFGSGGYTSTSVQVALNTTGKIIIRTFKGGATATAATGTSTVALDAWFRIEWDCDFSTGNLTFRYFATPDASTPTETIPLTATVLDRPGADYLAFGPTTTALAVASSSMWFDDLNVNLTGFPGPAGSVGTTYPVTAADTITVSDSATRAAGSRTRTAADTVALSDVATRVGTRPRTVTDSFSVSDSVTHSNARARTAADSITISDSVAYTQIAAPANETLLDDFNRADGTIVASSVWNGKKIASSAAATLSLVSNSISGRSGGVNSEAASAISLAADFDLVLDCVSTPATGGATFDVLQLYFAVQGISAAGYSGYYFEVRFETGSPSYNFYPVGGSRIATSSGPQVKTGDSLWFARRGSLVRIYHRVGAGTWNKVLEATDSSYIRSGYFGIYLYSDLTALQRWDNLRGGPQAVALPVTASDSWTVSDSATRAATAQARTATDSVVLADAADRAAASRVRTAVDSVAISDAAVRAAAARTRTASDAVTISDAAVRAATTSTRQVADNIGAITDAVTRAVGRIRTAADSVVISDAVAQVRALVRPVSDSFSVTDSVAAQRGVTRPVSDSITISDVAVRAAATRTRAAVDSVVVSDVAMRTAATRTRTIADSITLSDTAVGQKVVVRTANDSFSVTDSAARQLGVGKLVADSWVISDSVTRISQRIVSVADSFAVSDAATRVAGRVRTAVDVLAVSDAATAAKVTVRTAGDSWVVSDSVVRAPASRVRTIADSVAISDVATRQLAGRAVFAVDLIVIIDMAVNRLAVQRTASDVVLVSDTAVGPVVPTRKRYALVMIV